MTRKLGLLTLLALCACEADTRSMHGHDHDHTSGDPADAGSYEGCPEATPEFALGMRAMGKEGNVHAELVAALPSPPMRYRNDWTLRFTDVEARPLQDVVLTSARPFMPVHGHDGNVLPTISQLEEDGTFLLEGLNLNMRGPWEIQLQVNSKSAGSDYLVFDVCVFE